MDNTSEGGLTKSFSCFGVGEVVAELVVLLGEVEGWQWYPFLILECVGFV
jgi:hypothetical protein